MSTIVEYLEEYGDMPFSQRPFGNADAVILSQLCYFKFDGLIRDDEPVFLKDLNVPWSLILMLEDPKYAKENSRLYQALISGSRFRDIQISHYVNIIDKELETQFCAMTFTLPGDIRFVAYRGTDETMVGWKEDFNLTYMDRVPAQSLAVEYLTEASKQISGDFYVGGHSKGGHLAIYASMYVPEEIQDRLIGIYCLDGPGFRKIMMEMDGYARIRDRIVKLLPQSSLIGMLSERDDRYIVIKSTGFGLFQHNLYKWQIEHGELVVVDELKNSAQFIDSAVNDWIEELDPDSRQRFVDSLYEIFTSCDADNRVDFLAGFNRNAGQISKTLKGLDEQTAEMLKHISHMLIESAAIRFREGTIRNVLYK